MQKRLFLVLWLMILGLGSPLLVQAAPDAYIFFQPISGNGSSPDEKTDITKMIMNEIIKQNCVLLDTPHGTDFILYGAIAPYYEGYEDIFTLNTPPATTVYSYNAMLKNTPNASAQLYIFNLVLRDTETNENMVQQTLIYASIDDVYNFFPLLMYNLFTHILGNYVITVDGSGSPFEEGEPGTWRDKWIYLRISAEFPITFYTLEPDGLIGGSGIYNENPFRAASLDNKSVALPAGTLGVEFQLLNFMSIEPIIQIGWEFLNDTSFVNLTAGVELKVPLKFSNIMLEPYGAFLFPLAPHLFSEFSEIFNSYPMFGFGGGIQLGIKAGPIGVLFLDINYMYFGDTGINNPDLLHPKPEVVHYKRSAVGIGLGMKIGLIDRKKKEESPKNTKKEK